MPSAMLKIHPARDAQLAALAAARGTTKTAALDFLINLGIGQGVIPDRLPGYEAWAEGPAVMVAIEGDELPALSPRTASGLADLMVHLATTKVGNPGFGLELHNGGKLDIARQGTGIVLRFTNAAGNIGKVATLTATMAGDFSRALHTAAAHAAAAHAAA